MRSRKPNKIEEEYIKNKINDNLCIEKVLIHSVFEDDESTEYDIEVHHEELVTKFVGDKDKIDTFIPKRNSFTIQENIQLITKLANDCKVLNLLSPYIEEFAISINGFTFNIEPFRMTVILRKNNNVLTTLDKKLFGLLSLEIHGFSTRVLDLVHNDSIVLYNSSTVVTNQEIPIEAFSNFDKDDYFSFNLLYNLSKENFEFFIDIYKILSTIRELKYKISIYDTHNAKSYYRKVVKEYLNFDLEKCILDKIEEDYADCIKIS